jgi:uncharacterized surface protein with fasciclin (FAS1) repeats
MADGEAEEGLPVFQLTELVDELARSSDEEGEPKSAAKPTPGPGAASSGPPGDRSQGERTAAAFWTCAQEAGFTALCDALTFSGLRDELPRLSNQGITIIAPTNEAFALMAESVRSDTRVVRQLLLGHICTGAAALADLKNKNCAVAVAGQTHAVYDEEGHTCVRRHAPPRSATLRHAPTLASSPSTGRGTTTHRALESAASHTAPPCDILSHAPARAPVASPHSVARAS